MFDFHPDTAARSQLPATECVGRDAARLMTTAGERLVCAARRVGGDDGAALALACREMVLDAEVAPEHWPLTDLIALFGEADPSHDRQLPRLLDALIGLAGAIAAGSVTRDGLDPERRRERTRASLISLTAKSNPARSL